MTAPLVPSLSTWYRVPVKSVKVRKGGWDETEDKKIEYYFEDIQ